MVQTPTKVPSWNCIYKLCLSDQDHTEIGVLAEKITEIGNAKRGFIFIKVVQFSLLFLISLVLGEFTLLWIFFNVIWMPDGISELMLNFSFKTQAHWEHIFYFQNYNLTITRCHLCWYCHIRLRKFKKIKRRWFDVQELCYYFFIFFKQ